ncbi:MAG: dTDP-glucose 4,6-dehydratase [Candidatus Omnitrophota bacterium]|nr:dTDP-glucose 4,6-dehydratase [Candidatus Omnitrophota bacterium]
MRSTLRKVLITGGAGFIGSELVRQGVAKGYGIVVVDKLTYAGDLERLASVKGKFILHRIDIANAKALNLIFTRHRIDRIIHAAAETHVDRSILDVTPFIQTNVIGTQNLINLARRHNVKKFLHVSTDEIYGESVKGRFKETDSLRPNNPYAATKASAEMLVRAAIRTYQLPAIIIRPANNYGPWQYPEKFIPVIILKTLRGEKIPVYGKGKQIREWLHVSDCAKAIDTILHQGKIGETYNIGSYFERNNLTTARTILKELGRDGRSIQFVQDRPGHDFRYSVDCTKIRKLGWRPLLTFTQGIRQTIFWNLNHKQWLEQKLTHLQDYWRKVYHEAQRA